LLPAFDQEETKPMKLASSTTVQQRFTDCHHLLKFLELDIRSAPYQIIEKPEFGFIVPSSFAGRMRKRDWYDPLLLQALPRAEETQKHEGFSDDAVGDAAAQSAPGLLHKYASRVLLIASSSCAMHCRFCFRRCSAVRPAASHESSFRYIAEHPEIDEVILSGGDPLCLGPGALEELLGRIVSVPRVKTVRVHTRAPIADPGMLTQQTLDMISYVNSVKNCVVVVHASHANELVADCSQALTRLRATGAVLLNQSVLLKGINDNVNSLCDLSRALLDHGVLPYYLHQLDRVRGTWHFEVDEETGKKLIKKMREKLPGYAVPGYVREVAGEKSKRNLL
jgi:EF-P beta-lysylation protein EpmB